MTTSQCPELKRIPNGGLTAGKPRSAHTPRTPGAGPLGGARAGGPLRSAAGLLHDADSLIYGWICVWLVECRPPLANRSGHGDPLGMVSAEVCRARTRLTLLGAIPGVLALEPTPR